MVMTLTGHPHDPQWQQKRKSFMVKELWREDVSEQEINEMFLYRAHHPVEKADREQQIELTRRVFGEMYADSKVPRKVKSILDSTGGGTSGGSVLVRQDLEPYLYSLFVKRFPAFERIQHGESNGLVHAFNQITAPDGMSIGTSVISELGNITYQQSTLARQTANIAVFGTGRGVSFKEQAAVEAGGADYNPLATELSNGMTRLATDIQYTMFAQTSSYVSGTSSNEGGNYNANAFDGLRVILGSVSGSNYSSNSAIQTDIGTLNITETCKYVAAKGANAGGNPDLILLSMTAKDALDTENMNNKRYNDEKNKITAGLQVNQLLAANGLLDLVPVPGTTMGTYTSPTTSQTVEDIYVLDSSTIWLRWLYADNFTVLEIPSGVDSQLSSRYIVFAMYGLEVAAPLFCGKSRRAAS